MKLSINWFQDIRDMHAFYGMHASVEKMDGEKLRHLLEFRKNFLREEMNELEDNLENPEEVVDALIDLVVVAIGTLDLFGIDAQKAWDEVLDANMSKRVGIKEGRPNPLGLPDLTKPMGWKAPSHDGNHGLLNKMNS